MLLRLGYVIRPVAIHLHLLGERARARACGYCTCTVYPQLFLCALIQPPPSRTRGTSEVRRAAQVKVERSNKDEGDKFDVVSTDSTAKTGFVSCLSGGDLCSLSVWIT